MKEDFRKAWYTLATESEAQGALRSSVNQKAETESESEGSEEFLFFPIPLPLPSLPSCRFTLDQNFLLIPIPLATPLPSLPSLV